MMGNQDGRETVNILQAMQLVGVSRRTIYYWLAAGKLEYARSARGSVRIFTDTLWRTRTGEREQEDLTRARPA